MRRFSILSTMAVMVFTTGVALPGVAPAASKTAPAGKPSVVIQLERVEVNHIQPFFVGPRIGFKDCNEPGRPPGNGETATISLAYILDIKNSGGAPVMLDEMRFEIAFDDFDVNMANVYEKQWIPAGKTNQLRVVVVQEQNVMIGALSVGGMAANKIKQMGTTQAAVVKQWFDTVGDAAFPIKVKNGVATFKGTDGKPMNVSFQGVFPPPK
jgi:hypothetical protein